LPGLFLTLVLLLNVTELIHLSLFERLDWWTYDKRLTLFASGQTDNRVVILDIDEKSLAAEGRWPWSRNRLAELIDTLFDHYGAAVVGFDVVFAEKDESSGLDLLESLAGGVLQHDQTFQQTLEPLRSRLDYDSLFAESVKGRPVVLGYYFTERRGQADRFVSGQLPPPALSSTEIPQHNRQILEMHGYGANLGILQSSAASGGYFNSLTDPDGICRRIPMLLKYDGQYFESFSLAVTRTLLWAPPLVAGAPLREQSESDYSQVEWLEIADLKIPVDELGSALIPYRGRKGSYPYYSVTDILNRRTKQDLLAGAVVLVGTTAPGLMDLRATPVDAVYPGVEIHANMISGILDQSILHRPGWVRGAEFVVLLSLGLLLSLLMPVLGPLGTIMLTALSLSSIMLMSWMAWQDHLILPMASSLTLVLFVFIWNSTYGFICEFLGKRKVTGLFGQYVPPQLVAEMSKNPEAFTTEGQCRVLTVLFSDIRGFTSISEHLEPKELAALMNTYMSAMTEVIQKYRGTIDKYIGDAIMAFWGAPVDDPDHARNAVLAALEMQKVMVNLRNEFARRSWPELHIGIGLNTGPMNVGNMGSRFRMAYTVLGDAVNLGSRLEGITKNYGVGILISDSTRDAVGDVFARELDRIRVKGKEQSVSIFEPLGLESEIPESIDEEVCLFSEALKHFREREWDQAEAVLQRLQKITPDKEQLYRLYQSRIDHFRADPPSEDWDGVFQYTEK